MSIPRSPFSAWVQQVDGRTLMQLRVNLMRLHAHIWTFPAKSLWRWGVWYRDLKALGVLTYQTMNNLFEQIEARK